MPVTECPEPFSEATIADLLSTVERTIGTGNGQLEFPRAVVGSELFGPGRFARPEQLRPLSHCRLNEFGLDPLDRVVVRASGRTGHISFGPRKVNAS